MNDQASTNNWFAAMRRLATCAIAMLFLAAASNQSTIEESKVSESYDGKGFSNFLVLAIADSSERKQNFEDRFVRELGRSGAAAQAGWKVLPVQKGDLTAEKVDQVFSEFEFDAVLLVELIGKETREIKRAAQTLSMPNNRNQGLHTGMVSSYRTVQLPASTTEEVHVHIRSRLIDTGNAADVWIADTTTVNPKNLNKATTLLVRVLINDLRQNKLIARK